MSVKKVNKSTGATTKVAGLVNSEKVNTMYGAFPSDASASNKLVSDATADEKISDESQVIFEVMGQMGAKNLLPNIASSGSYASSGTVTKNANGSLTINGTFDAVTTINIDYLNGLPNAVFDVTDLVGTDIAVKLLDTALSGITLQVGYFNSAGTRSSLETVSTKANITFPAGAVKSATYLRIASGTYDNVTVYPMMQLASDTDDTYQPYAPTNKTLNEEKVSWKDNGILGAKNFVPYPYPVSRATVNGITFTTYSDGRVVANGTATELAILDVINSELYEPFSLDEGSYILTDGLSNSDYENAYTAITLTFSDSTIEYNRADTSIGKNKFSMPSKSNIKYFYLGCCVKSGATVSNLTFRPMIRLVDDSDDTYEPYAKTNQQLTKETTGLLDNDFTNGSVNMLPLITYSNKQFGDATNGYITINSNDDGSYTLNGSRISTAPPLLIQIIKDGKYLLTDNILKRGKSYKYTACPSNSVSQHLLSQINYRDGSNNLVQYDEGGNGVVIDIPNNANVGNCNIAVYHDAAFTNVVVKPMITLSSTPNSDYAHYVPYAMSNREITEELSGNTIIVENGQVNVKASTGTVADLLYSLSTAIGNVLSSMADNETLEVYRINIQSHANILPQLKTLTNQSYADFYGIAVESTATTCNIFRLTLEHSAASNNKLRQCHLESNGTSFLTPSDENITAERTYTAYYRKFRKI